MNYKHDFIQFDKKIEKNEKQNLALYLTTHITIYILLLFFGIFFIWYTVFITTHNFYTVSGPSMMPTLNASITDEDFANDVQNISYDAVYIDKFTSPKIFDIIVIKKDNKKDPVIKRLMGKSGDYVSVAIDESGLLHFYRIPKGENPENYDENKALVDEVSGINGYTIKSYEDWTSKDNRPENIIKVGNYTYLINFYQNYLNNYEERNDIYVSPKGLIFVQVPENKFFYLGDNRANSQDSLDQNDFEDVSHILGRSEFIVYNYNFGNRIWEVIKFYFSEIEKFFAR